MNRTRSTHTVVQEADTQTTEGGQTHTQTYTYIKILKKGKQTKLWKRLFKVCVLVISTSRVTGT